jgi:hypothetical protein
MKIGRVYDKNIHSAVDLRTTMGEPVEIDSFLSLTRYASKCTNKMSFLCSRVKILAEFEPRLARSILTHT